MLIRLLLALPTLAATTAAQVPAAPVLQNAFASAGLAVAANVAGGSGEGFAGAAAAWGLAWAGRRLLGGLQLSGSAGAHRANGSTRGGYGGRLAATLWSNGAVGAGAFVGVGGSPRTRRDSLVDNVPALTVSVVNNPTMVTVPAGVSLAYRHPLGASRGLSLYVSPMHRWTRWNQGSGLTSSNSSLRVALGLDFALSSSLGFTAGGEFGDSIGPWAAPAIVGGAISFVPRRS